MLRCELEVEWSTIDVVGNCESVQCEWYGRCVGVVLLVIVSCIVM
ncbi:hypothetical protein LINPERHAP2_LOCUS7515, partial [Linum perenne]